MCVQGDGDSRESPWGLKHPCSVGEALTGPWSSSVRNVSLLGSSGTWQGPCLPGSPKPRACGRGLPVQRPGPTHSSRHRLGGGRVGSPWPGTMMAPLPWPAFRGCVSCSVAPPVVLAKNCLPSSAPKVCSLRASVHALPCARCRHSAHSLPGLETTDLPWPPVPPCPLCPCLISRRRHLGGDRALCDSAHNAVWLVGRWAGARSADGQRAWRPRAHRTDVGTNRPGATSLLGRESPATQAVLVQRQGPLLPLRLTPQPRLGFLGGARRWGGPACPEEAIPFSSWAARS